MIRQTDKEFVATLAKKMFENPSAAMSVAPWVVNIVGVSKEEFDYDAMWTYTYEVLGGNHSWEVCCRSERRDIAG